MILQALVEYYDRRSALEQGALAPPGWEWKPLPFLIEITPEGGFVQIVDTRVPDGKRLRAKEFRVPQSVKRSVNVAPYLLWDSAEYALGIPVRNNPERVAKYHAAFIANIVERFGEMPADRGVAALLGFVADPPLDQIRADANWPEFDKANNPFIGFRLAGQSELVGDGEIPSETYENEELGMCLVSGKKARIARLHGSLKGVRGGNTSGTTLVGFNRDAFKSYGHDQGDNAPIGEEAAFKYAKALNDLLAFDSRRKAWLGESTFVFWAERAADELVERGVGDLFSDTAPDDPDRGGGGIRELLVATSDGSWSAMPDDHGRFYVLGLAPNLARVAVRTWSVASAEQIAQRLLDHFTDIEIVKPAFAREHPSVLRLLRSVALKGEDKHIPPNLQGEVAYAVLTGRPYPITLLAAALRRSCAEGDVTPERAALIKAVINRHRRASGEAREELSVALDTANADPAYRLGRLFAALERAQETASPGLNATIRDRYYGAASSTPITVFPRLLGLKNHHIAKIESPNTRAWLERVIGEIVDGIPKIPAHLSLIQQGDFAIGYYHQRQDFFRKRTSEGESN